MRFVYSGSNILYECTVPYVLCSSNLQSIEYVHVLYSIHLGEKNNYPVY